MLIWAEDEFLDLWFMGSLARCAFFCIYNIGERVVITIEQEASEGWKT